MQCCYYRDDDARLCVPKRHASMGWTVNTARPGGKLFLLFAFLVPIASLTVAILASQGVFGGKK